jgi:hypothetical protein
LFGHKDVETIMAYIQMLNQGPKDVRSLTDEVYVGSYSDQYKMSPLQCKNMKDIRN